MTDLCFDFFFSFFSPFSSKENCLIIDGLPVITPGASSDWHTAAKAQVFQLLNGFQLSMPGEVLYVKTLATRDGRTKLEAGLNSSAVAKAVRRAFFSFVRPNSPVQRPDWLKFIQINPSFTDGTRIRVLIMKVGCFSVASQCALSIYEFSRFLDFFGA